MTRLGLAGMLMLGFQSSLVSGVYAIHFGSALFQTRVSIEHLQFQLMNWQLESRMYVLI